jgi:hypothetical protein
VGYLRSELRLGASRAKRGADPLFVFFAGVLTLGLAALVVAGWRGKGDVAVALTVAGIAAASILCLALLLQLGAH